MADDLTTLSELSETNLINALKTRYDGSKIYTCIGDILIALNPYKSLPIYGSEKWLEYTNIKSKDDHAPHIYIISDRAYQNLRRTNLNQCCVVSGESGAGKTESTKLLIEHIAQLCKHDDSNLHEKIVEVNPLLEAFGNAQTVINNNSSRFGKFIELIFDGLGQIRGAKLSEYLLEKSRLVNHGPGEKNFHVFYYFFAGLNDAKMKANLLSTPDKHRIMVDSTDTDVYGSKAKQDECKETWVHLLAIMKHVGFTNEEVQGIEALLTAVVHISGITFLPQPETDGVSIKDDEAITFTSQLLGVPAEDLVDSLILNKSTVGSEQIISLKNETQANDGRDALAKALYGRLFSWIVCKINGLLAPKFVDKSSQENSFWIGILDIYGFENFQHNSFEQLCINIANEQLQLFFNEHIFKQELAEYSKEGIQGSNFNYVDNQPLLDLFLEQKDPPGVFAILDEESKFPQASDQTLIDKMNKNFSSRPEFQSTKGQSFFFTIKHFAASVTYSVDGFLEKNRDTLSDTITNCLAKSECLLVYELFSPFSEVGGLQTMRGMPKNPATLRANKRMSRMIDPGSVLRQKAFDSANHVKRASKVIREGKMSVKKPSNMGTLKENGPNQRAAKTLATQFKGSLCDLISKMLSAEPHFIRCIKPNALKASNNFNSEMVLLQLSYTGVLETIKIRKQGYCTRLPFNDFVHRYGLIGGVLSLKNDQVGANTCQQILNVSQLKDFQIGNTKVFLRYWHMEKLNAALSLASERIVRCQKYWKGTIARRKLAQLKEKALAYKTDFEKISATFSQVTNGFYSALEKSSSFDEEKFKASLVPQPPPDNVKEEPEGAQSRVQSNTFTPSQIDASRGGTISVMKRKQRKPVDAFEAIPEAPSQPPPEPFLPPLWEPVMKASASEPIHIFLQESLGKINTLPRDIWAKLYLMEKNAIIGKLYIKDLVVQLNDSHQAYTGTIIGINSDTFEHIKCQEANDIVKHLGQGITITKDADGDVYLTCKTKYDIYVLKGGSIAPEVLSSLSKSKLPKEKQTKIFDIRVFKQKVAAELKKTDVNMINLAKLSVLGFSVGKNSDRETDLPLWVSLINISALDLLGREETLNELMESGLLTGSDKIKGHNHLNEIKIYGCSASIDFLSEIKSELKILELIEIHEKNMQGYWQNDFKYLEELALGRNKIERIEKEHFQKMTNLKKLDLSENKLKTISRNLSSIFSQLEEINLKNNHRFICDCSLFWLTHPQYSRLQIENQILCDGMDEAKKKDSLVVV